MLGESLAGAASMSPSPWTRARLLLLACAVAFLLALTILPPLYLALGIGAAVAAAMTLRWPVVGFCLLAFSVPWGSGYSVSLGSFPVAPTDVLVALLGAIWLASALYARRSTFPATPWLPYILIFLAAMALSAVQASDIHASEREIVKWLELTVVYLAATDLIRTRFRVNAVVLAIVLAGVSQALLGYIQFAFQLGPEAFLHGAFLRAYGTFDQPNPYAGYLNMVLPLALAVGLLGDARGRRGWYLLAVGFILGAILASESRGALLATVVGVTVMLAWMSVRFRSLVWIGVVALALAAWLVALGLIPLSPFGRVLDAIGLGGVSFGNVTNANFSAVERAAHWLAGVRMFAAHPLLGVGIGNYSVAYPAYHPRGWYAALAHAHNYYINIAAESGIVGLGAYTLFIGSAVWYSCAANRRISDRFYAASALGVLGALITTSFHNLFDVLYVHGLVTLLGLLMSLVPIALRDPSLTSGWEHTST